MADQLADLGDVIATALDTELGSADWRGGGSVTSVNGNTGDVVITPDGLDDSATTNKFATAAQLSAADTAVQPGDLATVATSGAYGDLTGLPNLVGSLADLGDVDASVASPADGDVLVFRSTGALWVLEAKPAGGSNPAIGDITDVTITTVADNEVLAYDNATGDWINQTAAEAGLATAAQGAAADSAVQPGDIGTAAASDTGDFATAAQGANADSAVQPGDLISPDANNTLSGQVKFWVGSQADYDSLGTYDASTIYDVVS